MRILLVNGPNLNLLGRREPEVYGTRSFEDFLVELRADFPGVEIRFFQSNHEGEILDFLHREGFDAQGLVINAGGLSHTSIALADALAALPLPAVEVHISNICAREPFRKHSYLAAVCRGQISGLGLEGYRFAVSFLLGQGHNRV